jgi:hypothetical protein
VVTYKFTVRYRADDVSHEEQGQEVLVLVRDPAGWRVVWRTQVPLTAPPPAPAT